MNKKQLVLGILREFYISSALANSVWADLHNIPNAQFEILSHLSTTTNVYDTPSNLARIFRVSRPAMTQLVQRLVSKGWVQLQSHRADQRQKQVLLTDLGRKAYQDALHAIQPHIGKLTPKLRRNDLEVLLHQANSFRNALEEEIYANV